MKKIGGGGQEKGSIGKKEDLKGGKPPIQKEQVGIFY